MNSCFPVFEFYRICMFLSNILFGHVSPEACPFFIHLSPAANSAEILLPFANKHCFYTNTSLNIGCHSFLSKNIFFFKTPKIRHFRKF